MKMTF